jgi:hypothetical protein
VFASSSHNNRPSARDSPHLPCSSLGVLNVPRLDRRPAVASCSYWPQTNCRSRLVLSADWAMHSGEAVHEWLRTNTILLCSFRTIAADLETPAT